MDNNKSTASAFKWRITNAKYIYITDEGTYLETGGGKHYGSPFIYDMSGDTRIYPSSYTGQTYEGQPDEVFIKRSVTTLSSEEYERLFDGMCDLLRSDEDGKYLQLLSWDAYYKNIEGCSEAATTVTCKPIDVFFTTITNTYPIGVQADVFITDITDETTADGSVKRTFELTFGIPGGMAGPQGPVGPQGAQGYFGTQGDRGTQGYRGFQGYFGTQGYQGTQGAIGTQGYRGIQGYFGTQGASGTQGDKGTPGGIVYTQMSSGVNYAIDGYNTAESGNDRTVYYNPNLKVSQTNSDVTLSASTRFNISASNKTFSITSANLTVSDSQVKSTTEVLAKVNEKNDIYLGTAVGTMVMWPGRTGYDEGKVPKGWFNCNGDKIELVKNQQGSYTTAIAQTVQDIVFESGETLQALVNVIGHKFGRDYAYSFSNKWIVTYEEIITTQTPSGPSQAPSITPTGNGGTEEITIQDPTLPDGPPVVVDGGDDFIYDHYYLITSATTTWSKATFYHDDPEFISGIPFCYRNGGTTVTVTVTEHDYLLLPNYKLNNDIPYIIKYQ